MGRLLPKDLPNLWGKMFRFLGLFSLPWLTLILGSGSLEPVRALPGTWEKRSRDEAQGCRLHPVQICSSYTQLMNFSYQSPRPHSSFFLLVTYHLKIGRSHLIFSRRGVKLKSAFTKSDSRSEGPWGLHIPGSKKVFPLPQVLTFRQEVGSELQLTLETLPSSPHLLFF